MALKRVVQPEELGEKGIKKSAHSQKILLVEDEAISSLACKLLLENEGYSVVTARNYLEAVQLLSTKTFDLIFMDIQMPLMDGLEATKKSEA